MKRLFVTACALVCLVVMTAKTPTKAVDYSAYVNPMIGTDFTGNTYPGAQAPFGMVQLSPDNGLPGWDRIAGYFYPDSTIAGFSHTHLSGTGAGDLYDISFMPVTLPYKKATSPLGVHSMFSHSREKASAGYYQVMLDDYGINVELTATERCGVQRYTFPAGKAAVILNLKKAMNWDGTLMSHIEKVDSVTVRGYRFSDGWARGQKVYFCTRFSRPFELIQVDETRGGRHVIAQFNFNTKEGEQITVVTALSGTSMDGAQANLQAEGTSNDFDKYLANAKAAWNKELGKIQITTTDKDARTVFYTAMYHSMIAPTIFADASGDYYGPDHKNHKADGWVNYSTFSLWDTYRAAHPLYTIIQPKRDNDMVKSFLAFCDQNGRLPVWNIYGSETDMMIGYHSVPVIAEAYLKGVGDFDAERALAACVATANIDTYRGIGLYKEKGFVPYDVVDKYNSDNWSLSRTLEYAFDDYCIAKMAEKMGKTDVAETFFKRAQNYKNVYNPATTFMQPRRSDGQFIEKFNPDEYTQHICESNAWQYMFSVQHDIDGLIKLVGGKKRFTEKLDSMFTYVPTGIELPLFSTGMIGQYAQGNEPDHHVAYLFNAVGQPWKTQKYVGQIVRELYTNTPAGLCGNEDCGQMSAWYIFSSMGFYPVNPVSGKYEIGSPLFPEAKIKLDNGKTFTIKARNAGGKNVYVKNVMLNGKPLKTSYITHVQILSGATLEFVMGSTPGTAWYK